MAAGRDMGSPGAGTGWQLLPLELPRMELEHQSSCKGLSPNKFPLPMLCLRKSLPGWFPQAAMPEGPGQRGYKPPCGSGDALEMLPGLMFICHMKPLSLLIWTLSTEINLGQGEIKTFSNHLGWEHSEEVGTQIK